MEIKRELVPTSTLAAFADEHGLILRVRERQMSEWQRRNGLKPFMASFDGVEVMSGGVLVSAYGDGDTEAEAISDYRDRISCERIAVNAYTRDRQELTVPRLVVEQAA